MKITLLKSTRDTKKFMVKIEKNGRTKTVHFGARGSSDFTKHGDRERKANYLRRHKPREEWSKKGIRSPGFWARWVLWNKKTLKKSVKDIEDRFDVEIVMKLT